MGSGSQSDNVVTADTVKVISSQTSVAWQLQHKLVGQRWFIPRIVQGRIGPQQVILLNAALLPASHYHGQIGQACQDMAWTERTTQVPDYLGDVGAKPFSCSLKATASTPLALVLTSTRTKRVTSCSLQRMIPDDKTSHSKGFRCRSEPVYAIESPQQGLQAWKHMSELKLICGVSTSPSPERLNLLDMRPAMELDWLDWAGVCSPKAEMRSIKAVVHRAAHQVLAVGGRGGVLCLVQQLQQGHASTPVMCFICVAQANVDDLTVKKIFTHKTCNVSTCPNITSRLEGQPDSGVNGESCSSSDAPGHLAVHLEALRGTLCCCLGITGGGRGQEYLRISHMVALADDHVNIKRNDRMRLSWRNQAPLTCDSSNPSCSTSFNKAVLA
ncbi:MAG: hypothetical protein FRX49_03091 [Trebouxia sp. A1-2]|nr:MAG: hypothetical protein FRX49_03091 [Trebouxia sp. A1-2]